MTINELKEKYEEVKGSPTEVLNFFEEAKGQLAYITEIYSEYKIKMFVALGKSLESSNKFVRSQEDVKWFSSDDGKKMLQYKYFRAALKDLSDMAFQRMIHLRTEMKHESDNGVIKK